MANKDGLNSLPASERFRKKNQTTRREEFLKRSEERKARRERQVAKREELLKGSKEKGLSTLESFKKGVGEAYESMSPLQKAALYTAPVPGIGDVVGGVSDVVDLIKNPSWANLGFLAAGLLPFVPSGGLTKAGLALSGQRFFSSLRNDIPGFYREGASQAGRLASFGKTLPEGMGNVLKARYAAKPRAIQREFNISPADQKASRQALKISEDITPKVRALENIQKEMKAKGTAYTKDKKGKLIETAQFKKIKDEASGLRSIANNAAKKAMGQLNQSRSMTKQYLGVNSGSEGILKNMDQVDHIKTFKNFGVNQYYKEVGNLSGMPKEDISEIFQQIKTLPAIGMNPNKKYLMNIRRVHTGSAGELNPGITAKIYGGSNAIKKGKAATKRAIKEGKTRKEAQEIGQKIAKSQMRSLSDLKKSIFSSQKKYTSDTEFLEAIQKQGIDVLNPEQVLKGRAAIITGSKKSDAWELGGVNYMTAVNKKGRVVSILNDEHDLLSSQALNKLIKTDEIGKLPGATRYMNVSEPIVYDLIGDTRKLTKAEKAAKAKLKKTKDAAVKEAIENYKKITGVDASGKVPVGFKSKEQYLRAKAVAKLEPSHPDYARLVGEIGMIPTRAAKPFVKEDENKKGGGSVIERNPYNYKPRSI